MISRPGIRTTVGRSTGRALLLAGAVLLSALIVACSDDSESAPSATETPVQETPVPPAATPTTVAATAVPTATATPITQPGATTGIAAVDRVVTSVRDRDASAVVAQIGWQKLGCTTTQGLGGPPQCRAGEAPGTTVEVVFSSSCDGTYLRRDEVASLASRFVDGGSRLAGVYRHNGLIFPSSQYVLVYSADTTAGNQARALFVSDIGIVGFTFACGLNVKDYLETNSLTDAIYLAGG
jgi:hypothetical protein